MGTGLIDMRVRSVRQAYEEIKGDDPDTAITEYAIRKIVYEGNIPCILSGNKRLFCKEDLEDFIRGKRWPVEELRKINMYPYNQKKHR